MDGPDDPHIRAVHTYTKLANDLAAKFPEVAAEWHSTKNGGLLSSQVTPRSGRKVHWQCPEGHDWDAAVANGGRGSRR